MPVIWTRDNIGTATTDQKKEMDWVYATLYFRNQDIAAKYKADATSTYLEMFDRYVWAMDNRPDTAGSPPTPAFAMIVTGDITGWSATDLSPTERVCETKQYKPAPHPVLGTGKIGKRLSRNSRFWVCEQGDTTPGDEEMYLVTKDTPPLSAVFVKRASPIQSSGAGTGNVQVLGVWEIVES